MSLETIRLSQREKEQLQRLKRDTGIKNWNVLCRWALCLSLAEATPPLPIDLPSDSNVEMNWKTFAGGDAPVLAALLRQRASEDGVGTGQDQLAQSFRAHLHRGIGYLFGDQRLRELSQLVSSAAATQA